MPPSRRRTCTRPRASRRSTRHSRTLCVRPRPRSRDRGDPCRGALSRRRRRRLGPAARRAEIARALGTVRHRPRRALPAARGSQLADDLRDFLGGGTLGREAGTDLRQGVYTLQVPSDRSYRRDRRIVIMARHMRTCTPSDRGNRSPDRRRIPPHRRRRRSWRAGSRARTLRRSRGGHRRTVPCSDSP